MSPYRLLLHLYPASFRNEYGAEMASMFERRLRSASSVARPFVWLAAIAEVTGNASLVHVDVFRQDLRYVARTLRRAPGFAITAVAIVALGVGATTAAFSVADFVLIRPLPFREPDRLVQLWETTPGYTGMELSAPNYRDWMQASTSFESSGVIHGEALTIVTPGEPRRLEGASVSAGVFPTLGIAPHVGRIFTDTDDANGAPGTIVLSYGLWRTQFGGDPSIVGRQVVGQMDFDADAFTIIGVMPPDFHFPSAAVQFWVTNRFGPAAYADEERTNNWLDGIARLRPGVTLERAQAETSLVGAEWQRLHPKENKNTGARVIALRDQVSARSRMLLIALSAASACVLLIACMNLANLLLARGFERRRELAVRAAIGAGRERMVRQLMTESVLLALVGGALGVGLAVAAVPLLSQLVPNTLPIAASPAVDGRVIVFALVTSWVTGLGFGLAPIVRFGADSGLDALREGVRAGGGRRERLRSGLVLAEIVASIVLLVSAGLLIRALLTIQATNPGFAVQGVMTLRAELPMPQYAKVATRQAFYTKVLQGVRALPGVEAAGFVSFLPISRFRGGIWPVTVKGDAIADSDVRGANNVAAIRFVTPGFFAAMGMRVTRGRDVSDSDTQTRPFVAVVSESFARRYWPNQDPIGRHFTFAYADREVAGLVGDVKFRGLERQSEPQVYLPSQQVADNSISFYAPRALAVRVSSDAPATMAPAIRARVRSADAAIALTDVQTLADMVDRDTASRAAQVRVLAAFAAIAFFLAAVGIHGLLSFAVSQRTQEIGVRMALGAQPRDILAMVLRGAVRLGMLGLVIGVALAYAAGRSMEALLAGITPADAATMGAAVGLVAVMLVMGTLAPAIRALRIDPIEAIRAE